MHADVLRRRLIKAARRDAFNVTSFVAVLQQTDASMYAVDVHALPRVLRLLAAAAAATAEQRATMRSLRGASDDDNGRSGVDGGSDQQQL
jgi:hypothetical protein